MSTHDTPQGARTRRAGRPDRPVLGLAGCAAVVALALVGSNFVSHPASAGRLCGERDQILAQLEELHGEKPQALGLSADGGVVEVLVSPKGGWTILVTYPSRSTCVVAVGENWEALQAIGQPA